MKKILSATALIGILTILALPMMVLAQEPPEECCQLSRGITLGKGASAVTCNQGDWVGPTGGDCSAAISCATPKWGMFCLMNTLYSITDWVFVILVALAGIFVIIGAMTLLTAAGAPEKVSSGRNYIMYAAIGLIVGLLSKAIPSLVRMIGGM
ncbi:MAG: hypothetical protein PHE52_02845 [Candidatus Pacebacteria bacterium]|nr:hypothetical protein [Candidatus Paceibacterota bacterium]